MDNADRAFEGLYATDGNVADNAAALRTAIAGGAITPAAIAAALGFLPAQGVGNTYLPLGVSENWLGVAVAAQAPPALTMDIPSVSYVQNGVTVTVPALAAHTFTDSVLTYLFGNADGWTFSEQPLEGGVEPTPVTGKFCLGFVQTDGGAIGFASGAQGFQYSNADAAPDPNHPLHTFLGPEVPNGIRIVGWDDDGAKITAGQLFHTSVIGKASDGSLDVRFSLDSADPHGRPVPILLCQYAYGRRLNAYGPWHFLDHVRIYGSGDNVGDPSFRINSNVLKATPVAGGFENDGTSIYWTADDASRHKIADATNGITGTVTTASLVGKTLTFTNGVITGFA